MTNVVAFPGRNDAAARERIETSLDESLMVEAAAGTGKTTALVGRIVAVLRSGRAEVDGVVAVTFTRKAAGELKLRLRRRLDESRAEAGDGDEKRRVESAIARLEEARIGTIHSFCAELLRERPVEAGVDPDFVELDDPDARRLFGRAFEPWVEGSLEVSPPGLRRALSRLAFGQARFGESPLDRLRSAAWTLAEWRDHPAPWRREPFDRSAAIVTVTEELASVAAVSVQGPSGDPLRRALGPAEETAAALQRGSAFGELDDDATEGRLLELLRGLNRMRRATGRGRRFGPLDRDDVRAMRDGLIESLETFRARCDADLAVELRAELGQVVDDYQALKRQEGGLDFLDLLVRARDLISEVPEVRTHFQQRISHLFVDEFQDTDPLQAEILLLLAADDPETADWEVARPVAGKLFLVGDPKQSIYRFRRADVLLYQSIRDQLGARGVETVYLTRSFRAVRPLQEMINASFAPAMRGDRRAGQPEYIPLDRHREGGDQPSVIVIPAPRPYGSRYVSNKEIEVCLPDAIGALVEWLVRDSGWTVEGEEGELVGVAPSHVAILFRRYMSFGRDVTRAYVRALEDRDVPHVLHGGRSFHQREEVETLRAALRAIEWPDDELSVFATLKGSLFAITDGALFRYRQTHGSLHPFRSRPTDLVPSLEPIADALAFLAELHRRRNNRPIPETISELLAFTRAHAGFALRPAGNQVLANVLHVCDIARGFEIKGGLSFRGFVDQLDGQADRVDSRQSPVVEEAAEGVRLMTVHGAKGLEFPVVVLADMTCRIAGSVPSRYVDGQTGLWAGRLMGCAPNELLEHTELENERERAEGVRVAYVAATRARDLLVVPAVGDGPRGGWLEPLEKAVFPLPQDYRSSKIAPACPPFGDATVLARPSDHDGRPEASVRPGLHLPEAGGPEVVWWDPAVLRLGVGLSTGLRREDVLIDEKVELDDGMTFYREWRAKRAEAIESGSLPSYAAHRVTDAGAAPGGADRVEVVTTGPAGSRPSGLRFGTLVHRVLERVPWDADRHRVEGSTAEAARVLQATQAEVAAACDAVWSALEHPLLRRAAAADRALREARVVLRRGEDELLEGTIDLAFRESDGWVVVDYKTDAEGAPGWDAYREQVAWYVDAVAELSGEPARGYLLRI